MNLYCRKFSTRNRENRCGYGSKNRSENMATMGALVITLPNTNKFCHDIVKSKKLVDHEQTLQRFFEYQSCGIYPKLFWAHRTNHLANARCVLIVDNVRFHKDSTISD
ncbi:hypothetical protein RF11_00385 [Thelohanellus kitauei]|uniref:Uncharacterized protein n=1 Tax=Thelohanellus kitauei TaxID=669202 RepID=A0A0C2M7Q5_THEKT|nr:hypothetical protein RF11_00385 [Thelohanellus kitauei]